MKVQVGLGPLKTENLPFQWRLPRYEPKVVTSMHDGSGVIQSLQQLDGNRAAADERPVHAAGQNWLSCPGSLPKDLAQSLLGYSFQVLNLSHNCFQELPTSLLVELRPSACEECFHLECPCKSCHVVKELFCILSTY